MGLIETCNSGPKCAVLHAKTTDEGWDPVRLVILMPMQAVLHAQNHR